jgi:hypothetical protein
LRSRHVIGGLLLLFVLTLILVNLKPAWALTVTPSSPTAGVSFTVSGTTSEQVAGVAVYSGAGCVNANLVYSTDQVGPAISVAVPGQPTGQYSAIIIGDPSGCVNFTINSASPIPEYPLGVALLALLIIPAYTVIKRRTRN